MKNKIGALVLLAAFAATMGCHGDRQTGKQRTDGNGVTEQAWRLPGDSTVYGLTCEGSGDTVLVLLPEDGSDPIRYNIEQATREGRVLGNPQTGDRTAIVVSKDDKHVAELVIDIDELKGIWCYLVMPTVREGHELNDSLRQLYFIPREYGFALLRQWTAQSVGYVSEANALAGESPVVYPQLGYFTDWHILNGKLVITRGTPALGKDNETVVTGKHNDTCDIVFLRDDSLVLASEGQQRSYYRKQSQEEVNQKAKEMTEILRKQALATAGVANDE
ncbi:MAG: hypothetical protein IJM81_04905 [Prevotella sp.]|nr:hypothetical protein [Prevotella sp.]